MNGLRQIEVLSYWKIDKSTPEYQEYRAKVEEATAKRLLVENLYRAGVEDLKLVEQAVYHYDAPVQQVEHQEKETQEEEDDMEMSM